ncbi:hypothetical protein FS837_001618 [Tulasnella sp. UAMH 9824]|nr:hypothetical protein FS837_001618 [Tulasnella sp. UAMH 9824]
MNCLDGEDILSLRESCLYFYGILKDQASGHLWDVVREDAGIVPGKEQPQESGDSRDVDEKDASIPPADKRPPLPTPDEIQIAKYVLQSHCMLWSGSIPGIETPEAFSTFAPKKWAFAAVERVKTQLREHPEKSYIEVGNDVASWLKETRSFCAKTLRSLVVPDRSNQAACKRLARQRQQWISGFILRLDSLKFVPEDIPEMDEVDVWSKFIHKSVAAGTFEGTF